MGKLILKDGSRVAIIGGGPAGSLFAFFLQKFAQEKGLNISTSIFDGKDFLQKGPRGCNLCAGVIAESLNQKLMRDGIFLPEKRIVNRVDGYCLHIDEETLFLTRLENTKDAIATVFRGNGPRYSTFPETISFDDFLLSLAQNTGTGIIPLPVWGVDLPNTPGKPLSITYGRKSRPEKFEADLVVGAFGVNTYLTKKVHDLGFGYKPPSTLMTYQAEIKLGHEKIFQYFGNAIHVYMPRNKALRYATVIPKGDYVTLTLIGRKNASPALFQDFLDLTADEIFPSCPQCACYPKIAVSPAKKPFTDRLVMIGDASFSRHYKNGIESAFITARWAAAAAIHSGIDAESFHSSYFRPIKKMIVYDNTYGRYLFAINDFLSAFPLLRKAHLHLALKKSHSSSKKIRSILWNMFTGAIPYRQIFTMTLDSRLHLSLLFNTIGQAYQRIKRYIRKLDATALKHIQPGSNRK